MSNKSSAPRARSSTSMLAIYDGRDCIGHLIGRGKNGVEVYDTDDRSLGIFSTQAEAVRALTPRRGAP